MDMLQEILKEVKQTKQEILEDVKQEILKEVRQVKQEVGQLRQEMLAEVGQLKIEVAQLNRRVTALEADMQEVKNSQILCENLWFPKIEFALESCVGANDVNTRQDGQIDKLQRTTANHSGRIFALESIAH